MAKIVLGLWTTHGPTLSTRPEEWTLRLPSDHSRKDHPFQGGRYDFDTLVRMRAGEGLAEASSLAERTRRAEACQRALGVLADVFEEARIDVAVIFGNDQNELFLDDIIPALTVFHGPMIWNQPATEAQRARMPPGIWEAEGGHRPHEYTEYPGHPELGTRIIQDAMAGGFEVARSMRLPNHPENWSLGIGHAFGFIYRQIMRDKVVPNVPIIANTFFPPNQPTARRCFEFGQLVGRTIRDWDADLRVAVIGSGGMSHFVIDEAFDHLIIDALQSRDAQTLCAQPESYFQTGTSELKNWIAAAGALFDTELSGPVVDYQPCYRSEAGTGTANGFVYWR